MAKLARRTFIFGLGSFSVISYACSGTALRNGEIWPHGRRAAVSLTYDDGLDSQLDNVAPGLDRLGAKATFFLTRENAAQRIQDWEALARRGHEIGDHTFHHPCEVRDYDPARYEREEIAPTEMFLDEHFGPNPARMFAYPCGAIELGAGGQLHAQLRFINLLRRHFAAARAADGDPNDPRLVTRERFLLQAVAPTYDKDDPELAIAYLRKTLAWRRWAVLIFHNVLPSRLGDGDTSIATHDAILEWIGHHSLWCAPMGQVFAHLTGAEA